MVSATNGANNVTIDHNTVFETGFILGFDWPGVWRERHE